VIERKGRKKEAEALTKGVDSSAVKDKCAERKSVTASEEIGAYGITYLKKISTGANDLPVARVRLFPTDGKGKRKKFFNGRSP